MVNIGFADKVCSALQRGLCILLLAGLLFCCGQARAQAPDSSQPAPIDYAGPRNVSAMLHYGVIWAHNQEVKHLGHYRPMGVQVDFSLGGWHKEPWRSYYRFAHTGISVQALSLGQPSLLGNSLAGLVYFEPYIAKPRRSHYWCWRLGTGGVLNDRPFRLQDNFRNTMISNWLSFTMQWQALYNLQLVDRWWLRTGLSLTHFSNGGFKMPNYGMNIWSLTAGVTYRFSDDPLDYKRQMPHVPRSWRLALLPSFSRVAVYPVTERRFWAFGGSAWLMHRVSAKSQPFGGADVFYNGSYEYQLAQDPLLPTGRGNWRAGLFGGHELFLGSKVSFMAGLGFYVYKPQPIDKPLYQRLGISWHYSDALAAHLMLKTHYGKAECVQLGVSVRPRVAGE